MKITECQLYHNMKLLNKTNNIKEMNYFIQNDGSDYNITNIKSFEYKGSFDIRIDFETGSQLFLTIEK